MEYKAASDASPIGYARLFACFSQRCPEILDRHSPEKKNMRVVDCLRYHSQDLIKLVTYWDSPRLPVLGVGSLKMDSPVFQVDFIPRQVEDLAFSHTGIVAHA